MEKRARRKFTAEYKAEVVRLVRDGGKTVGQVSRDLDLTEYGGSALGEAVGDRCGRRRDGSTDDGGAGRAGGAAT